LHLKCDRLVVFTKFVCFHMQLVRYTAVRALPGVEFNPTRAAGEARAIAAEARAKTAAAAAAAAGAAAGGEEEVEVAAADASPPPEDDTPAAAAGAAAAAAAGAAPGAKTAPTPPRFAGSLGEDCAVGFVQVEFSLTHSLKVNGFNP
jgi:hypothetical protein